jgi:uncharacterized membrane protein
MDIFSVILRILHIFGAVAWVGGAWMMFLFIEPTVHALGPDGGKFMNYMATTRRYPLYISAAAVITLLAGILLFGMHWRAAWNSPGGLTFLIGGIVGIIAGALGGMIGATSGSMMKLGGKIAQQGKPPSAEQQTAMRALQSRLHSLTLWTALMTTVALLLMVIAPHV